MAFMSAAELSGYPGSREAETIPVGNHGCLDTSGRAFLGIIAS